MMGNSSSSKLKANTRNSALKEGPAQTLDTMLQDPDIIAERQPQAAVSTSSGHRQEPSAKDKIIRLNVPGRTHYPSPELAALLEAIGGIPALEAFTSRFYELAFADPHLDRFIREHNDPHGHRFALWIAQKFGGDMVGNPWDAERATRPSCPFHAPGVGMIEVNDRSSAHFAAWHSPKRPEQDYGEHFQLDDCRVWMRLHFRAARESGAFDNPTFEDYYVKFIGHFVRIYERTAPAFVRESARWSKDPKNIEQYHEAGNTMADVMGLSLDQALKALPHKERAVYTGGSTWPYGH